ncbi:stAR-related lipid transfer protein 13-like isoform X3 [Acanthaster planci]|uniref:StAR-related lipid transfer protein 13-like isoform X3 n=1 Tax=Acanthaster planci TaxID=133434 RepID=A0A8B7Y133_ACAPL|nr:stAR-related lipid transfer protein 13-like isoform X3 [Acanthaster planci]
MSKILSRSLSLRDAGGRFKPNTWDKLVNRNRNKRLLEIEAAETCQWLRAAGFPQYAQMFEECLFPIDISSVERDHDFLDQDLLDAVTRRLHILNKCSSMKIEAPLHRSGDESDEEDQCAISNKWKYTRSSGRWSRRMTDDGYPPLSPDTVGSNSAEGSPTLTHTPATRLDSSSRDSLVTTDNEGYTSASSFDSPAVIHKTYRTKRQSPNEITCSTSLGNHSLSPTRRTPPQSPTMLSIGEDGSRNAIIEISSPITVKKKTTEEEQGSKDRMKGAKNFLKRLDSLKLKRGSSQRGSKRGKEHKETLVISEPVIDDQGTLKRKIELFNCVDLDEACKIKSTPPHFMPLTPPMRRRAATGEKRNSEKRKGRVFSEPSSPLMSRKIDRHFYRELEEAHMTIITKKLTLSDVRNNNDEGERLFSLSPDKSLEIDISPASSPGTLERKLSCSGTVSCQCQSCQDKMAPWSSSEELSPKQAQTASPWTNSVYDNVPRTVHSSSEHVSTTQIAIAECEFLRQIYNLKNIGSEQSTADQPHSIPSTSTMASDQAHPSHHRSHSSVSRTQFETEKHDILTNITQLLLAEKNLDDDHLTVPIMRKRTRSNSLPDTRPCSMQVQNVTRFEGVDPELDGINTELEKLLNGINQSLHEMQENLRRDEGSLSSASSHSQVSSPVYSPVSSTFPSPFQSPLPSPHLNQSSSHKDLGDSILATSQDTTPPTTTMAMSVTSEGDMMIGPSDESLDMTNMPTTMRERRDSGVGNSLTRPSSSGKRPRIRWHSFQKSHRPSLNSRPFQISGLSVSQLLILRKLSLLKLTSLMERHSVTHRSGWSWMMPRFMKRIKSPDYKDRNIFGVPLLHILQTTGLPLPQSILYAMRFLRRTSAEAVGIFRKPGVRSRIQQLKRLNESNPDNMSYEGTTAYDVADMLKQYFRDLPEPVVTTKLSDTFISIFTSGMPKDLRLSALQAAIMLLPDENREVLQSLLLFLSDIAENSNENQMTAYNLAVCFAPSLFQLGKSPTPTIRQISSPRRTRKMATSRPDQKELIENVAANECLALMIREVKKLFMVPEDLMTKCHFSYMDLGEPVELEELGRKSSEEQGDYMSHMESCLQGLLKESRDKFKGWVVCPAVDGVDVAYKKVGDGHPLRLWKCSVEIGAPPADILQRVLRERHLWDEDLVKWRTVDALNKTTEVFQYVVNSMAPHPSRDYCVLRYWRNDLPRGTSALVSTSIEHPDGPLIGGVRGTVLASRFLIEPCGSGKSRLTHICRVDTKGRTVDWYNKAFGHIMARLVGKIRDLYIHEAEGPETKV